MVWAVAGVASKAKLAVSIPKRMVFIYVRGVWLKSDKIHNDLSMLQSSPVKFLKCDCALREDGAGV
jgi:hypothetical protein